VVAALAFVRQVAQLQLARVANHPQRELLPREQELIEEAGNRVNVFDFGGPLSFGAAANLGHEVRTHAHHEASVLILDFSRVPFLDVSSARAIADIAADAKRAGRQVYVAAMREELRKVLSGLEADRDLDPERVYPDRVVALEAALEQIRRVS
jgi:SulP family sulfate permease